MTIIGGWKVPVKPKRVRAPKASASAAPELSVGPGSMSATWWF